jgi:hypothetical protein
MKNVFFSFLVVASCGFAQINVPLTVRETLYPGSMSGVARTNEPLTVGVPLPDSAGITSTTSLGLSGATAAQFTVEGKWPDGNIKWVKVRAIVPSVSAGGTSTVTLTNSGAGNFGGADMATDNGATITVNTGVATFTIKKSNYNVFDQVVMGATTLVASGTSQGVVVLGPTPTAAYPANVTCLPTSGGSPCTTIYSTANDGTNSTATIEENGPAMAVVNAQADLNDGAGHVYMHVTVRMYFSQGSSKAKLTTILRNADYGANSSNFATAYKGIQGMEVRITPNLTGSLRYNIANHTASPTTGTLNSTGGTDYAYIYQAESTLMKVSGWCSNGTNAVCVPYTSLSGYAVVANGTAVQTGASAQYPTGWADISDAGGNGVEIGQYQFAGYGNKSLEFRGGGTDLRIGVWASENNTTSTSATTANKPYYIPYPQYSINDVYLNFHVGAPASLASEFLKQQHYLVASAATSWYNTTNAFMYPLLDPSEEDAFYSSVTSTASPAVSGYTFTDVGTTSPNSPLTAWRYYSWAASGASNQMEIHESRLLNFIRRGHTGGYLDAAHFYKMVGELAFPRADGFSWTTHSGSETNYFNYPSVTYNSTNANRSLGMWNWLELGQEHAHWYGMPDYYWLSGDETVKDAILNGAKDHYLNTVSANNLINIGKVTNARAAGTVLMGVARLHNFFALTGDTVTANALLARGNTLWTGQIKPDLCANGYPAGCVANTLGPNGSNATGANQRGTSKVRGVSFQFGDTSFNNSGCSTVPPVNARTYSTFMQGIMTQGMWEFRQEEGSSWSDYNTIFDTAYGVTQAMFGEMYQDNGGSTWSGNGLRYKSTLDFPSACGADFGVQNPDGYWPAYYLQYQYLGQGSAGWFSRLKRDIQGVYGVCAGACMDEMYQYTIANLIQANNHGNNYALNTVPISGFASNGNGSYTITWNVPAGANSYRVKWGPQQIVDYIGFAPATSVFIGNPATTMNWFAATDATGIPAPSGATQSLTISTGVNGLTAGNFMVKAYVNGAGQSAAPPTISVTAPAAGATLNGTVTVSATAVAAAGVANVQFRLDGASLGTAVIGAGPSYSTSWDTTKATNASHVLSAVVTDLAGNAAVSGSVSITVTNNTGAPALTNISTSISSSGATITWATNVQADGQVAYGPTAAYGFLTTLAPAMVVNHSVTLVGLSPSTAYHYQVLSHNVQGILASSSDATFTTAATTQPNTGAGTSVPVNTWTSLGAKGWPAQILNYDKSEYISSRKLHCIWGAYKQWLSSEHNNALVCYSYPENAWHVLENNGYWHSSHAPGVGHSVSIFAYISDKDAIAFQADGSGSNSPESFPGIWWWYDMGGLSGQNREFSPRPWVGSLTPLVEMMTYDPVDKKLILYDQTGTIQVCDPNTNACVKPTISGTAPPSKLTSPNMVYNSTSNTMYIFGGGQADTYTISCNSNACTSMTGALLAVSCTGPDCVNGKPPARLAAGMAYSPVDNVMMMVGGLNSYAGALAYSDTWIFSPATRAWTEQSPANGYPTTAAYFTADRLTYDPDSNTFLLVAVNGYTPLMYAYPYSPALNYGRVSNVYTPPAGSLNRVTPTATSQSWSFDPTITTANNTVYLGWIESGANSDNSTCGQTHHPYIQSGAGSSATYYPAGAQTQTPACMAIDPDLSGNTNASKVHIAVVNGTLWEAHEKINHNQSYYSSAFARFWTGSAWSGGAVGCFSAVCSGNLRQNTQALLAVGNAPTLATIEWNHATYTPEGYLYVSQWNGTAWAAMGSKLNINGTGSQILDGSMATDGVNPAACWSEQVVDGTRANVTTTPQIQCSQWNGSSWARLGQKSFNQNASSWASDATMTYVGGKYYIGWVERTTAGTTNLYVCRWDGSSCTVLGGGLLNNSGAGWAAHPSLANDGANVYVAWEEQPALGQHSMGYVKQWNGTSWSQVGSALNADPINGSVEGITLAVVQGMPTAIWGELTFGNLRQTYAKQWNGSAWVSLNGFSATPPPPPTTCDLNGDGVVNAADVQLAINQALGLSPCGSAALQQNGQCNVVGVQRVINASLGGVCRIGP